MLNLIVSKPLPFAQVDFSNYKKDINRAIKEGHTPCIMEYLHGEVQSKMGYDISLCLNAEECVDFEKEKYKEGIYDTNIKGYNNPCKAFLWNTERNHRGLIVDSTNKEDIQFAQNKYNKKCILL